MLACAHRKRHSMQSKSRFSAHNSKLEPREAFWIPAPAEPLLPKDLSNRCSPPIAGNYSSGPRGLLSLTSITFALLDGAAMQ